MLESLWTTVVEDYVPKLKIIVWDAWRKGWQTKWISIFNQIKKLTIQNLWFKLLKKIKDFRCTSSRLEKTEKKNHKELSFNFSFNLFSYPPHFFKSICTLVVSQLGSFKFYQPMKGCCHPDRIWRMLTNVLHVLKLFYGSIQNSYKVTA